MNKNKKVLIVDDEKNIVDILKFNLMREGFSTLSAYDGEEAMDLAQNQNPDLILLDVMLPKLDGFSVCRKLRQTMSTPIIMLTAKEEEVDKVLGLELGADDYVTKPFSTRELLARVKANLRRIDSDALGDSNSQIMEFGDLKLDMGRYAVLRGDKDLELTLREFELLKFLAFEKGKIFSRESLLEKVWGYEYFGDVRTVDVTIRRLREKVEHDPANPQYIITKRGVGYYFNEV